MIAVDTNLLVYSHRHEGPFHDQANKIIRDLAEGKQKWAIPWPCIYEFLRVVTHPHYFKPPTPAQSAEQSITSLCISPSVELLAEGPDGLAIFSNLERKYRVTGNAHFDLHILALCIEHGVSEIWTADTDFHRYKEIRAVNPLQ